MTVLRSRDLYHQIIDVNPNSATAVPFVTRGTTLKVSLFLYGSAFQGALAAHSHAGANAHSHDVNGTISSTSVSHSHGFSGTTVDASATHGHSASSGTTDVSHSHSGSTADANPLHSHSGTTASSTEHRHTLAVDGAPGSGIYLVHTSDVNGFSSSNTEDRYCTGSVMLAGSHVHGLNTDAPPMNHSHGMTVNSWLGGSHTHSIGVSSGTATHNHGFSGTTGANDILHSHTFSGLSASFGSGLEVSGISTATLPSNVNVYVDGALAAGPFSGEFAAGELDISSFVSGPGQHTLEIREEGGSGGRITYNLFVE